MGEAVAKDAAACRATLVSLMGLDAARRGLARVEQAAVDAVSLFGPCAAMLRWTPRASSPEGRSRLLSVCGTLLVERALTIMFSGHRCRQRGSRGDDAAVSDRQIRLDADMHAEADVAADGHLSAGGTARAEGRRGRRPCCDAR